MVPDAPRSHCFLTISASPPTTMNTSPANSENTRYPLADSLLFLTVAVWGINFSVIKFALAEFGPLAFNSVRFMAAAITVGVVARATGRRWAFDRRHLPWLIGLGLLGNSLYQLLFVFGAARTTADNAALMLGTVPAWVALGGMLTGQEKIRPLGWVGIGLSLLGITMIILGADREAAFRFGGATLTGDLLVLAATLCWATYTLLCRHAFRHYGAMTFTSFSTIVGAAPLIVFGLPELARTEASAEAWAAALLSGTIAIGLAYFIWNYGISKLGSARTALFSNFVPVIALFTAWLWLGETLTRQQGSGAFLAIVGVVLARHATRPAASR